MGLALTSFEIDWQGKLRQNMANRENYRTAEETTANHPAVIVLDPLAGKTDRACKNLPSF